MSIIFKEKFDIFSNMYQLISKIYCLLYLCRTVASMENQRPSSSEYRRLRRQRMTSEQCAQEGNTRNAQRRLAYTARRHARQNGNATAFLDITNQDNSTVVGITTNSIPIHTCEFIVINFKKVAFYVHLTYQKNVFFLQLS